jgi:uncharacterized protein GlcG (DUF336 family)
MLKITLEVAKVLIHAAELRARELYGINTTNHGRVVVFGGGILLSFEGRIVGAVGASGSKVANDIEVAKAAVRAFETYPKARIGSSGSLL